MTDRLLLDADFLFALTYEHDASHQQATEIMKNYRTARLYITIFTLPETATVLSYKLTQKIAKEFLKAARKKLFVELPLESHIVNKTDKLFLSQTKKGISWIDCYNAVCVKEYRLDGILSFDRFYKKSGIKMVS